MRSKISTIVVVFAVFCFMMSATFVQAATTLKGASAVPTSLPWGAIGNHFKEKVEAKTDGQIEVRWLPGGEIGGESAILRQLQDNVIQFATLSNAITGNLNPKLMTMYTPYLIRSWDEFDNFVKSEAATLILGGLEKHGIMGFGFVPYGFNVLGHVDPPIQKLEDCKGRKFRTAEAYTIKGTLEALGMNAVPLPITEVYQSLQRGVVEGLTLPAFAYPALKLDEVVSNYTVSQHLFGAHVFWMRKDAFEKLSPEQQKIIKESIAEVCKRDRDEVNGMNQKTLDDLKGKGAKVIAISPEEMERWSHATREVLIEHEKRIDKFSGDGHDFLQRVYKGLGRDYDKEIYGQ